MAFPHQYPQSYPVWFQPHPAFDPITYPPPQHFVDPRYLTRQATHSRPLPPPPYIPSVALPEQWIYPSMRPTTERNSRLYGVESTRTKKHKHNGRGTTTRRRRHRERSNRPTVVPVANQYSTLRGKSARKYSAIPTFDGYQCINHSSWRNNYRAPREKIGLLKYWERLTGLLHRPPNLRIRAARSRLNPILSFDPHSMHASLVFDLRLPPHLSSKLAHMASVFDHDTRNTARDLSPLDLFQFAFSPPLHRVTLWHRKLPWYITISSPNGCDVDPTSSTPPAAGLTVQDLLRGLYESLDIRISPQEYYAVTQTSRERLRVKQAFNVRCPTEEERAMGGMKRVDVLGSDVVFVGLQRSKPRLVVGDGVMSRVRREEVWEIVTKEPVRERFLLD